ncbi:MAG: DUF2515 family protein [Myxococcota bacterium]
MDPYQREAERLIADVVDDPAARSRRICALYATFFLEDSLLYSWCGLASFVAREIYFALEDDSIFTRPFDRFFATGNVAIYRSYMPALLRFRDGGPQPDGDALGPSFEQLARARDARDPARRRALAKEALLGLAEIEQAVVCQPIYDRLPRWKRRYLGVFYHFRLGWDTASPVIRFPGRDPGDLDERRRWMHETILPTWLAAVDDRLEALRRDCDENRREAEVRASRLPPIQPFLPVVPPFPVEPAVGGTATSPRPSPS